jgi:UDP-glucose 4-epimerase
MKCLVTGGAGFIGTNLIKRLLKDNHKVVAIDNYSTGHKENEQDGCTYFKADIRDVEDYSFFIEKPDVIFHIAALARIQPSLKNPKPAIDTNVNGTLNILEWARQNDIQVIYAGSSSMHHGIFNSPYAWSKYAGEELCKLYSKIYNLNTTICRFYNVYGQYHIRDGDYATVLGIFEQQYMDGNPLTITADGEQRRDFTHVDDIVDGLVRCADKDFRAEEFELGSGVNYSINQIAKMFGNNYPKKYIPARSGEYDETLCTDTKAHDLLNWKPKGNIKNYIDEWVEERI